MIETIKAHIEEVKAFQTDNKEQLEAFRIKYLGSKGLLKDFFAEFKNVPNEQKKEFGQVINELKTSAEEKVKTIQDALENKEESKGIYDTMQFVKPDVATICTGMAASMGAVLLCAGAEGKRSALPHSRVMIHQPSGGAQGVATDMEINLKEMLKLKDELYEIISKHSGKKKKKVHKDSERDYWMIAAEAKEYGMIDEVLTR